MPLQIDSIRLGHATNSSSTHSIIFMKRKVKDNMAGQNPGEFGWQHFTAGSREMKSRYLASLVRHEVMNFAGPDIADIIAEKWIGPGGATDDYVDPQSALVLPLAWDGKGLERMYLEQLKRFLLQDGVYILGGSDNSDEEHPLLEAADQVFQIPHDRDAMVARWDESHQFWTLFDRRDGAKIRMRFLDPGAEETPITKAEAPELVDFKITDYCPFGCEFCYQDSTEKGHHANYEDIQRYIWNLAEMRVFEVAIGGGEPTLHPKFLGILRAFRSSGIIPNFTTKRIDWLEDKPFVEKVFGLVGGVGISNPNPYRDIERIAAHCILNGWDRQKIVLHYVMGSGGEHEFKSFLTHAAEHHFPVLLLGWKNVGRGCSARRHDYSEWVSWWKELRENKNFYVQLSVDTALAKESKKALDEAKIPTRLYEIHEGRFSMYLDAVNHTVAASSYDKKTHTLHSFKAYRELGGEIKRLFSQF